MKKAYDLGATMRTAKAWDETSIPCCLEEQPEITATLSKEDLDDAFDYHYHIGNVDLIFKRVGIL